MAHFKKLQARCNQDGAHIGALPDHHGSTIHVVSAQHLIKMGVGGVDYECGLRGHNSVKQGI